MHIAKQLLILVAPLRAKECDAVEFRLVIGDIGPHRTRHQAVPDGCTKRDHIVQRLDDE